MLKYHADFAADFVDVFDIIVQFDAMHTDVALLMLLGLFVRRYLVRPEGLETRKDDALMHGLLFAILLSGFVLEGARMAVTELGTPLAVWSPVGLIFAHALSGMTEPSLRTLHAATWWGHFALVIGFIGGLFPAIRAAQTPVAHALREQ